MAGTLPDEAAVAALYPPSLQLLLVQVVHRHGERRSARTPPPCVRSARVAG
jgi:hypothetical protein